MRQFMRDRPAYDLRLFRIVHNSVLCFGSFIMVLGIVTELVRAYFEGGMEALLCDVNGVQLRGNLYNWYYIFFLSKFYEFVDTFILVLRKKPITFLHCFHHFITALVCWLGLYDQVALQWPTIGLNGTVHVFMYYYYLAVSFNSDLWWKKYLTTMQIAQFCVDIVLTLPYYYYEFVLGIDCHGHSSVLLFSNAVLICFLILFVNFFYHTYKKNPKTAETKDKDDVTSSSSLKWEQLCHMF